MMKRAVDADKRTQTPMTGLQEHLVKQWLALSEWCCFGHK